MTSPELKPDLTLTSPIGLIAGNGYLPIEFAKSARERGLKVVAIAHLGESDSALAGAVDKISWIRVGQLGKAINFLKKNSVRQLAFAGGIRRPKLFSGHFRLDARALKVIARTRSIRDDVILRAVAEEFQMEGLSVISPTTLLPQSVPVAGVLTVRSPSSSELGDIELGYKAAKSLGQHDIGQALCVVDGVIVALEAVEGTDAMIRRAKALSGRAGVVVKVCKPQQDIRLDLPTIGPETVAVLKEAGATVLAIEAGRTIIINPQETIMAANRAAISIVAM